MLSFFATPTAFERRSDESEKEGRGHVTKELSGGTRRVQNDFCGRKIFCAAAQAVLVAGLLVYPNRAEASVGGAECQASGLQRSDLPLLRPRPARRPVPTAPTQLQSPGIPSSLPESVPPEVAQVLTGMAAQAEVIFVGRVRSIDRQDAHGFVDIAFDVQTVLRGTAAATYVLREWAGLWTWQQDRYRADERVLLLLRKRSSSGFSSPVGGLDGALPLFGGGPQPLMNPAGWVARDTGAGVASGYALANARVDLRWIAAKVVRSRQCALNGAGSGARLPAAAAYSPKNSSLDPTVGPGPVTRLRIGSGSGLLRTSNDGAALSAVLTLLTASPEAQYCAR